MAIIIKRTTEDGQQVIMPLQQVIEQHLILPPNLFSPASHEVIAQAQAHVDMALDQLAEFKSTPKKVVHNLFEEALEQSVPPEVVPGEKSEYTLLMALDDFANKKFPKKTLTIVHKTLPDHTYRVKDWDANSGRAKLEGGFKGGLLKPVITEREDDLYVPMWN